MGQDSEAGKALDDARARAVTTSEQDQLGPMRPVDPQRPLTVADRRRIAEFEEVATHLHRARRAGTPHTDRDLLRMTTHLRRLADALGIVGGGQVVRTEGPEAGGRQILADAASTARAQRVREVIGGNSEAGRTLVWLRRTHVPERAPDGLQPGRRPHLEADVPSAQDRMRIEALNDMLSQIPQRGALTRREPLELRRARRAVEAYAAELGSSTASTRRRASRSRASTVWPPVRACRRS